MCAHLNILSHIHLEHPQIIQFYVWTEGDFKQLVDTIICTTSALVAAAHSNAGKHKMDHLALEILKFIICKRRSPELEETS